MADPASRKSATLSRLRSQLRRKRESLADQFDFKMYIAVVFKDKVSQKHFIEWPSFLLKKRLLENNLPYKSPRMQGILQLSLQDYKFIYVITCKLKYWSRP